MPRKLRVQYPGAIYHLMSRGDRREDIFADDRDRERFLETLEETCRKTGWQILAYCLMSDHFHCGDRDPATEPFRRHEMAVEHLHPALQPAAQGIGPSF